MAEFQLQTGETVLVDDEDFDRVSRLTWHIGGEGYVKHSFREDKKVCTLYLHQFILPGCRKVDHESGNRLDNRKNNLRPATQAQNQTNTLRWSKPKASRFKGVAWQKNRGKWVARIGRKRTHLGMFEVEEDAARAYDAARLRLYGEFAKLNFPA